MEKKRTPCEIWTRVMGYLRPVSHYNVGKKSEFYSRKYFDMKKVDNSEFVKKFLPMKDNFAWDYGDEYAFGNEVDFEIKEITHNVRPRSNQGSNNETSSACTIIGALNQIIRLFGIDLSLKESNNLGIEVVHYCEKIGYRAGYGWDTPTAINAVCKFWNEIGADRFGTEKVFYVRRQWTDDKAKEALRKGHLVGFTMALNFGEDKIKGLVRRDKYPGAGGHRLNWQSTKTTKPTGGASEPTADCGVYDNYYGLTNQYLIRDRSKYMNKGMYTPAYMIFPQSWMAKNVEEEKKLIAERKAVNYVLGALSNAYESVPDKFKEKFAQLAKELRADYPDARQIEQDKTRKQAIAITDAMSYLYKFADADEQKTYAELADSMRKKYDFN